MSWLPTLRRGRSRRDARDAGSGSRPLTSGDHRSGRSTIESDDGTDPASSCGEKEQLPRGNSRASKNQPRTLAHTGNKHLSSLHTARLMVVYCSESCLLSHHNEIKLTVELWHSELRCRRGTLLPTALMLPAEVEIAYRRGRDRLPPSSPSSVAGAALRTRRTVTCSPSNSLAATRMAGFRLPRQLVTPPGPKRYAPGRHSIANAMTHVEHR
jgi:hypothetical protein